MNYQPKGGMCLTCTKAQADCSALPFEQMRVIQIYADGTRAVKCIEWVRAS